MNEKFGSYTILRELGRGARGAVYLVEKAGRQFALKVPLGEADEPDTLVRFRQETLALARLSHRNIVAVEEVGEHDQKPFVVMELLNSPNLGARLKEGPLPKAQAVDVAIQLAEALKEIHRQKMVHRDLKPENVILNSDGHVKLVDFGMVAETGALSSLTPDLAIVGTLVYSAPEQCGVKPTVTNESVDLYSLGIVLFEMLIGKTPYDGLDSAGVLARKMESVTPNVHSLNSSFSPVLADIIIKLTAQDANARYQTAQGLLMDLRRLSELEDKQKLGATYQLGANDRRLQLTDGPMVGHAKDLERVATLWRQVRSGRGALVIVQGGSGVGKKKFISEVAQAASASGALSLSTKCSRLDSVALAPVSHLLKSHFARILATEESARQKELAKYQQLSASAAQVLTGLSPDFAEAVGFKSVQTAAPSLEVFFQSLIEIFAHVADLSSGLVLAIENAHWLDESSNLFLRRLGREAEELPILIALSTGVNEESNSTALEFIRAAGSTPTFQVKIEPFTAEEAAQYISGLLGGAKVDARAVALIAAPMNNNAYGIRAYVESLLDADVLKIVDKALIIDEERLGKAQLTLDTNEMVKKRIAALPTLVRQSVCAAAVLGMRFSARILAEVLNRPLSALQADLSEADGLVEPLVDDEFGFKLEAVREVLIGMLDPVSVENLRQRAIDALESVSTRTPDQIQNLATQYLLLTTTPDPERKLKALVDAGRLASQSFAKQQAYTIFAAAHPLIPAGQKLNPFHFEALELYVQACFDASHYDEAQKEVERLLVHPPDKLARQRFLTLKHLISVNRGDLEDGWETFLRAASEMGIWVPRSTALSILVTLLSFLKWWLWHSHQLGKVSRQDITKLAPDEVARLRLTQVLLESGANTAYLRSRPWETLQCSYRACFRLWRMGPSREYVMMLAISSAATSIVGVQKVPKANFVWLNEVLPKLADPAASTFVRFHELFLLMFCGQSKMYDIKVEGYLANAARYLPPLQFGNWFASYTSFMSQRGEILKIINFYAANLYLIDETKNLGLMANVRQTFAGRLRILGRRDEADRLDREAEEYFRKIGDRNIISSNVRTIMKIYALMEWGDLFDPANEELLEGWLKVNDRSFFVVGGYVATLQVRLLQYEIVKDPKEKAHYIAAIRRAAKVLNQRSRTGVYDTAKYSGMAALARIEGKFDKARQYIDTAERIAIEALAPNGTFLALAERARLARAEGRTDQLPAAVQALLTFARERQWESRLQRIRQEFPDYAQEKAATPPATATAPTKGLSTERALNALIEISTATAEFIDPIEQGRVTLDTVVRLLSAERACIFLGADSSALKFFLGRTAKAEDIVEMKGFSTTVVRKVFEERKAVIITGTEQGEAIGSKSIVAHNLKSIMVVPLMLQENIKGVIYLDSSINKGLFSNDDLDLFVAISAQIAASLQISELAASESERQLMKKDLEISASVQKMFLPEKVHLDISDVKVEAFYRPAAQCGGDWWWYRSQAGHVAVVVGDVTGHGAGPAMITASIATCFRMMQSARDVRELLLAAHSQLLEIAQTEYAMAMFAVDVDVQSRKVKYWSAGAPQALVIHKDEKKSSHLHVKGSWLGMHNFVLGEAEYDFREGDRIFIFSDGIVEMEMTDGRQFGERRLDGLLQKYKSLSLEDFKLKLVEELDQIRGGSAQEDDFTFVVIELH